MEMSPQQVRSIAFSTVKKGYDSGEVNAFVQEVATALEAAQNDTTAMEARARAAVARLQELSQAGEQRASATGGGGVDVVEDPSTIAASVDETETISRTLLLAQRTADVTVAEANAEAERILSAARDDASQSLDQAQVLADQLIQDSRDEARRAGEGERINVESEVQALNARRDFLESDVDHLEAFLIEQRERIRESATVLSEMVDRVPGGLGAVHRPLLSAAGNAGAGSANADDHADDADDEVDEDDTQPHDTFSSDDSADAGTADSGTADSDTAEPTATATNDGDVDSTPSGTSPRADSMFPEQRS
ncbi:hypothetical protein BH18ACT3_BH18ACT3_17320 [soil metagenome]